jgi:hypothetical protein
MTSPRLPAKRRPGRPVTHGARQALAEFRRGGRLNYSRTHVRERAILAINLAVRLAGNQQWDAVETALTDRCSPKVSRLRTALDVALAPLDAVQREDVLTAAEVGAVYAKLRHFVFSQRQWILPDGELIACLRRSFLAFGRDWSRHLQRFNLAPEDTEDPLEALQRHLASHGAQNTASSAPAAPQSDESTEPKATHGEDN